LNKERFIKSSAKLPELFLRVISLLELLISTAPRFTSLRAIVRGIELALNLLDAKLNVKLYENNYAAYP